MHSLSNAAANDLLWALADQLGSIRDVVDNAAVVRIHRDFDSFGNIASETHYNAGGAVVTSGTGYVDEAFAFTGRFFDKATGLQNNLNRWYDPTVGRWMSEDPIGFDGGDANLYRYVGNSPTNYVDPNGLDPVKGGNGYGGNHVPGEFVYPFPIHRFPPFGSSIDLGLTPPYDPSLTPPYVPPPSRLPEDPRSIFSDLPAYNCPLEPLEAPPSPPPPYSAQLDPENVLSPPWMIPKWLEFEPPLEIIVF